MDLADLRLDNQVRQTALIKADLVLALLVETNAEIERTAADLQTSCTVGYCALRAIAPRLPASKTATKPPTTTPGAGRPRPVR
jgi:hypothetical protein